MRSMSSVALLFGVALVAGTTFLIATSKAQPKCRTTVECAQVAVEIASKMQDTVKVLQSQIDDIQSQMGRISVTVTGDVHFNEPDLSCPTGQVMVGIELALGGTCKGQCDADGRPVRSIRLRCKALKSEVIQVKK